MDKLINESSVVGIQRDFLFGKDNLWCIYWYGLSDFLKALTSIYSLFHSKILYFYRPNILDDINYEILIESTYFLTDTELSLVFKFGILN